MHILLALLGTPAAAATLTVDPAGGADYTSLTTAIIAASSGDTIELAAGTYTGPFDTRGRTLIIRGDGTASTILTAGSAQTVLTVDNGESVTVTDLTLYSALQGLEVRSSTVNLTRVHVTDHSGRSPGSGAGVYDGGNLRVTSCEFARNEASGTYSGGGIYVSDSTLTVDNTTFINNAAGQGGALYIDNSVATLTDVSLEGNIAATHGGGIRVRYESSLNASGLTVTNNTAGGRGGGLSSYQADVVITDGEFSGNQAGSAGGALHLDQTSATAVSLAADITDNTATTTGGGIHADTILLELTGTLSQNAAGDDSEGGGMYAIAADITLNAVDIQQNTAETGGGIYSFYGGSLQLSNVNLSENAAGLEGGGIYTRNPLTIEDSIVQANTAVSNGGGVATLDSTLAVTDTDFVANVSGDAGGAVYLNDASATFSGNLHISESEAVFGAGVAVAGSGAESVHFDSGQVLSDNAASGEGGGLFLSNVASAHLDGLVLSGNTGTIAGGGARLADIALISAIDLTVIGNASEQGGGLHLSGMGVGETAYSRFAENTASNAGGAIFAQNPAAYHPLHHLQFVENASPEGAGLYLFNDDTTLHPVEFSDFAAQDGPAISLRQSAGARVTHVSAAHNSGDGFEADTSSAPTAQLEWNASWDNGGDFGGALPNLIGLNGNVAADPDYAGVTRDGNSTNDLLIPGSNSQLRDMGSPGIADLDGTIADIGHLGGPDARDQDYDADGIAISAGDCDDAAAITYPGAAEVWYNGEDNDCNGGDDYDADFDGSPLGEDCDDTDPDVNPDADDPTVDGTDQNCDGDDGPPGADDGADPDDPDADSDLDGDGIPESEDCDDSDASAFPGNVESCGDGTDNDCDGFVDDFDNDCIGKGGARACSTGSGGGGFTAVVLGLLAVTRRRTD